MRELWSLYSFRNGEPRSYELPNHMIRDLRQIFLATERVGSLEADHMLSEMWKFLVAGRFL